MNEIVDVSFGVVGGFETLMIMTSEKVTLIDQEDVGVVVVSNDIDDAIDTYVQGMVERIEEDKEGLLAEVQEYDYILVDDKLACVTKKWNNYCWRLMFVCSCEVVNHFYPLSEENWFTIGELEPSGIYID